MFEPGTDSQEKEEELLLQSRLQVDALERKVPFLLCWAWPPDFGNDVS